MKYEIKCENVVLGVVKGTRETEDGIELIIEPTDEFYKMRDKISKAISKVKLRTVNGKKIKKINDRMIV